MSRSRKHPGDPPPLGHIVQPIRVRDTHNPLPPPPPLDRVSGRQQEQEQQQQQQQQQQEEAKEEREKEEEDQQNHVAEPSQNLGADQKRQDLLDIAASIVPQATEKGTKSKPRNKKTFDEWVDILGEYRCRTGHFNLPRTEPSGLGQFINKTRFEARRGELSKAKLDKLASIGFVEEARDLDKVWNDRYDELVKFHAEHGHYSVSYKVGSLKPLGQWIRCQRAQYQRYLRGESTKLSAERIRKLEALGLDLSPSNNKVTNAAMMRKLEEYRQKYGEIDTLESYAHGTTSSPWRPLSQWMERQRKEYGLYKERPSKSKLTKEFVKELRQAGVIGRKAKKSKKRKRNTMTGTGRSSRDSTNGAGEQGAAVAEKVADVAKPSPAKKQKSKKEQVFEQRMIDLKEFHTIHGHSRVPQGYAANPSLGHFVTNIRSQYRKREQGKPAPALTDARIEAFADLDFEWNPRGRRGKPEENWDRMFRQLGQYKADHGTCNVPKPYPRNPKLAEWVVNQRKAYRQMLLEQEEKSGTTDDVAGDYKSDEGSPYLYGSMGLKPLMSEQYELLQGIGFDFAPRGTYKKWEERLADLEAYKAQFGHCNVPEGYVEDPGLARFVRNQRLLYKQNKRGGKTALNKSREIKMKNLGFVFERRKEIQKKAKNERARKRRALEAQEASSAGAEPGDGPMPHHTVPGLPPMPVGPQHEGHQVAQQQLVCPIGLPPFDLQTRSSTI